MIQEINQTFAIFKEKNKDIELIWIPSYRNIQDNENVDLLTKKAANKGELLELEVPFSDIFNICKSQ